MDKLERLGMVPTIEPIQQVPHAYAEQAERYWIGYYRQIGCRLTNSTDGGGGCLGRVITQQTKDKIGQKHRGKTISPEHKEAVSRGAKKAWVVWRATGERATPEILERLRLARELAKAASTRCMKGVPKTEEHRRNMSLGKKRAFAERKARQCQPST